jgi:hypothetical protein
VLAVPAQCRLAFVGEVVDRLCNDRRARVAVQHAGFAVMTFFIFSLQYAYWYYSN